MRYECTVRAHEQLRRSLWLTPEAYQWCFPAPGGRHPEGIKEDALAQARYKLNSFVLGRELEQKIDLWELRTDYKQVWEIRTTLSNPQLRLFGWFPQPNHFVVVHGKNRNDLEPKDGPKWEKAIQKVVSVRRDLMQGEVLYLGVSYGDYIS